MKNEHVDELIAGIKEAGKIKSRETEASRKFDFPTSDIKTIREEIGFSQSKFAALFGVNIRNPQNWSRVIDTQPTQPR